MNKTRKLPIGPGSARPRSAPSAPPAPREPAEAALTIAAVKAEPPLAASLPWVGRKIGRYRVCFELASGGMATVYLARLEAAAGVEKVVALKTIHPHLARDPSFVAMFLDEARIASQIAHSNVCQIFDFGVADGSHYLAMEYLVGEPLARVLRAAVAAGELESARYPALVARIVGDACEGLHAVHELCDSRGVPLEIVHRDVTPQNLFVTYEGAVKVVDFGIARARDQVHRTATGEVKGNMPYVAPEQVQSGEIDRRADVWSLGVILWEMIAGRPLFLRGTTVESMYAVLEERVPPLAEVRPGVSAELAAIVDRALKRDRDRRWPTARELGLALQEIARAHGGWPASTEMAQWMERLMPEGRAKHEALVAAATTRVEVPADARGARRRGWWWLAGGAAVAVIAGAVAGATGAFEGRASAPREAAAAERTDADEPPSREPPPVVENAGAPEPPVAEASSDATEEPPRTTRSRRARTARTRETTTAAAAQTGRLNVVTPDGWAVVYANGRRLGDTPLQTTLAAGDHVLTLRPFGEGPAKRVPVRVGAEGITRVSVRLRD